MTETKTGSVMVVLSGKQDFTPSDDRRIDGHVPVPNSIRQHKYSIHPTKLDPSGNQIHHRIELDSGHKIDTYHFSKALQNNRFAYVSGIRSNDLSHHSHDIGTSKKREIFIGLIDPSIFSLYFSIIVCGKENKEYFFEDTLNYNFIPFQFSNCIIIVIWSYGLVPTGSGRFEHTLTVKRGTEVDKTHRKVNKWHIAGFTKNAVIQHYIWHRENLRKALEKELHPYLGRETIESRSLKAFFHDGVTGTFEWFDFSRQFPRARYLRFNKGFDFVTPATSDIPDAFR